MGAIIIDEGYHYNLDGTADPIALLLDCFKCQLYFFVKKCLVLNQYSAFNLFTQDFNICCVEDRQGNIVHVGTHDSVIKVLGSQPGLWNSEVFSITIHEPNREMALREVESLLDQGEKIIIETQCNRVPYFISFEGYDSPSDRKSFGHVFLAIGHQGDNLYFVDFPYFLSDQFISHPVYPDIGVASKEKLGYAFSSIFRYVRIVVNAERLPYYTGVTYFNSCVSRILASYDRLDEMVGEYKVTFGRRAYASILAGFKSGTIDLFSKVKSCEYYNVENFLTVLDWQFHEIKNRRKIFLNALLANKTIAYGHPIGLLDYNISIWSMLNTIVCVDPDSRETAEASQQFLKYLSIVADMEERIMNGLREETLSV